MRVIAGQFRGRRLKAPSWEGLRPTSDKLRETLFNILAPRIAGARVLDAYAGTGAVGIEAISRGAVDVVFVDHDRRAAALIAANVALCGIADGYAIIRASVARALGEVDSSRFDVMFFDPPYDADAADILTAAGDKLAAGGVVVLEHARRKMSPERLGGLTRSREVASGDSMLSFYVRTAAI